MANIGYGYSKTDKNGKPFISLSFDKALLPFTVTEDKRFTMRRNENKKDAESKAPDFILETYIPKPQNENQTEAELDPFI